MREDSQTKLREREADESGQTGGLNCNASHFHRVDERGRNKLKLREREVIVRQSGRDCESGISG